MTHKPISAYRTKAQQSLWDALESGPIERVEIELMSSRKFRWKLWSGGRLTYCATGDGVASEVDAMIKTTCLISKAVLGVQLDAEDTASEESH